MRASARISAWVRPDRRDAFRRLARSRALSDSRLLTLLIAHALQENELPLPIRPVERDLSRALSERITIRVTPGDAARILERARAREMRPATYLAALVHSHATAEAAVPVAEIAELKRAVAALTAAGRHLRQMADDAYHENETDSGMRRVLPALVEGVERVRRSVKDYIGANASSWGGAHE